MKGQLGLAKVEQVALPVTLVVFLLLNAKVSLRSNLKKVKGMATVKLLNCAARNLNCINKLLLKIINLTISQDQSFTLVLSP